MDYLAYWAVLCSTFFLTLSLDATLVITKIINQTSECFTLRIHNGTPNVSGTCTHESIVPAYATQDVKIMLLKKDQPHAYIIKAPLMPQANIQEIHDFIEIDTTLSHFYKNDHKDDFTYRDRSIAYIAQPVGKTIRTLYTCIPQNPYKLDWWYLGMPLKQACYAFYAPHKYTEQEVFYYLPFTPTAQYSLTTSSDNIALFTKVTRLVLSFHDDQVIRAHLDL